MDLSQGSVKLEDDPGKVPLRFPVTTNGTAQQTVPQLTLVSTRCNLLGSGGGMAEN